MMPVFDHHIVLGMIAENAFVRARSQKLSDGKKTPRPPWWRRLRGASILKKQAADPA